MLINNCLRALKITNKSFEISLLVLFTQLLAVIIFFNYSKPFLPNTQYFVRLIIGTITLLIVSPTSIKKPSDFFLLTNSFFILGTYNFFANLGNNYFFFGLCILTIPMLVIKFTPQLRFFVFYLPIISIRQALIALTLFSIVVQSIFFHKIPYNLNLSFNEAYIRRLAAREIFLPREFLSYLLSITSNSILGTFAFLLSLSRAWLYLFFVIILLCILILNMY